MERKGDDAKRAPNCREENETHCPNMHETGGGFRGEQYNCSVCGAAYFLDYEDMK